MKKRVLALSVAAFFVVAAVAYASGAFRQVSAREFDPAHSHLVQAEWLSGIGCPTGVKAQVFQPPDFTTTAEETVTDPACTTGDPRDRSLRCRLAVTKSGTAWGPTTYARVLCAYLHDSAPGIWFRSPGGRCPPAADRRLTPRRAIASADRVNDSSVVGGCERASLVGRNLYSCFARGPPPDEPTVLPRRIHRLKDQEHAPRVLGVQPFLHGAQPFDAAPQNLVPFFLLDQALRILWIEPPQ